MARGILEVQLIDAKGLQDTDALGDKRESVRVDNVMNARALTLRSLMLNSGFLPTNNTLYKRPNTNRGQEAVGDMDPYVLIQYRNQEQKSSVARGQGRSPSWNESFKFQVHNASAADHHQKLILRIMDEDTFTTDDFVGQAMINVADLISLGVEKGSSELHPCKYSVVLADRTYCGEIRLGVKFTMKIEEDMAEEFGGWKRQFC